MSLILISSPYSLYYSTTIPEVLDKYSGLVSEIIATSMKFKKTIEQAGSVIEENTDYIKFLESKLGIKDRQAIFLRD